MDRWTILGLSWGTTLGLAYAQAHPHRVNALVLGFVTTTSRREVQWITEDVGRIFPQEWDRFANAVPDRLRNLRLVDAYAAMPCSLTPTHLFATARQGSGVTGKMPMCRSRRVVPQTPSTCTRRSAFASLGWSHTNWRHAAFLEDDQLIREAARLNNIPGALIHGRYDVSGPLVTAWRLSQRWSTSRLHILDDAGHGGGNEFMPLVLGALKVFAAR